MRSPTNPETLDEREAERELVQKVLEGFRDGAGNLVDEDEVWADIENIIAAAEERKTR